VSDGDQTVWTPQAIEARVEALDNAWQALDAAPRDQKTRAERRAFLAWRTEFEKRGWLERNFATSVLPEIERWEKRYDSVRKAELAAGNKDAGAAPDMNDLQPPDKKGVLDSLITVVEVVALGAGAAFIAALYIRSRGR